MAVDDSYTKALLHLDGADGATVFRDETGKIWTGSGSAQIDTAQSVFGGASLLLASATSDYVSTSDHEDFNLAGNDWTFRWRIRFAVSNKNLCPFGQVVDKNNRFLIFKGDDGIFHFLAISGGSAVFEYYITAGDHGMTTNTWYDNELTRSGNNLYFFVNGISKPLTQATTISGKTIPNYSASPCIGRAYWSSSYLYSDGWIDEMMIVNGAALHTTDFTPPTSPYGIYMLKPIWFM